MPSNVEREVTFSPDKAGERVGWVSIGEVKPQILKSNKVYSVNVVAATVGDSGAWFGRRRFEDAGDKKSQSLPIQEGFLAVTAISHILSSDLIDDHMVESNLSFRSGSSDRDLVSLLDRGVSRGLYEIDDPSVDWAHSRDELLDTLKGKLTDSRLKEAYPQLYYWLNGTVKRRGVDSSYYKGIDLDELMLPDRSMKNITNTQIVNAKLIRDALSDTRDSDFRMRRDLSVFTRLASPRLVHSVFVENRRLVAGREEHMAGLLANTALRRMIYLPPGVRRDWPYMDGTDYGRELSGLKNEEIEPAYKELGREIDELEYRREYVEESLGRLTLLSELESATS